MNLSLRSGSDHEIIETEILNPDAPSRAPGAKYRVSPNAIETFTALIQQHAPLPTEPPRTVEQCEELAEAVLATFRLAIEGSGRKTHHTGHASGWWDEECIEAQKRIALDCTAENKKALYRTVPWVPIPFLKSVPLSLEIAEEETREAVLGTGNTSPGSDGITVALVAAAWPHMAKAVHMLFLSAVRVGYHPRAFRYAEVVMIPKPGKALHNTAKKWRPISLLSCIGKGLERLLARRVARTAIAFGIIPAQYFGALPKRACTDLVACLIHDIEKALAKDMIAALITLDVSGAFDIVLCKRLIYRLRQQGWPDAFVHWAESFMTGRTVTIRTTEGEILPEINLSCGTPQGSPISPIIFMLYLSPLLRLGNEDRRFGSRSCLCMFSHAAKKETLPCACFFNFQFDVFCVWFERHDLGFDFLILRPEGEA